MSESKKSNIHIISNNDKEKEKERDKNLLSYLDSIKNIINENPKAIDNIISIILLDDEFYTVSATAENSDLELLGLLEIVKQKIINEL